VLDRAAAIDQQPYLAVKLGADRRELRRKLTGHDLGRCDTAAIELLQRLDLARLEPGQIPSDFLVHSNLVVGPFVAGGNLPIAVGFATDIVAR
jgi:hypothetical protein